MGSRHANLDLADLLLAVLSIEIVLGALWILNGMC